MKTRKAELIWEKAKPMRSKSPGEYRLDPYGHTIRYATYPAGGHSKETPPPARLRRKSEGKLRWATNLDKAEYDKANYGKADCQMKKEKHSKSR